MNIEAISNELNNLINSFSNEIKALDVYNEESKNTKWWTITLQTIKIEFTYTKKESNMVPISSLLCSFYLEKNGEDPYTIEQVVDYLNIEDFKCYNFSFIENEKRLTNCFNEIRSFILDNLNAINELVVGDFNFAEARNEEYKRIGKTDELNELIYPILFENQCARYTNFPAYKFFLQGDYQSSLKIYHKLMNKNSLYDYEKKLVAFMERLVENGEEFEAIKPECASMIKVKEYDGTSLKSAKILLASFATAFAIMLVPLTVLLQALYHIYTVNSGFSSAFEAFGAAVELAIITAFCLGLAICDKVMIKISKDKEEAREFANVLLPKGTKIFAQIVSAIAIIGAVVACFLIACPQFGVDF